MSELNQQVRIAIVDDDEDDRILMRAALAETPLQNPVDFLEDGEELIAYLRREGRYSLHANQPLPALILLDLNMPRKNGKEALAEIRADDALRHVPVVMLTTSQHPDDVLQCYQLGANGFITKPTAFADMIDMLGTLSRYWLGLMRLP